MGAATAGSTARAVLSTSHDLLHCKACRRCTLRLPFTPRQLPAYSLSPNTHPEATNLLGLLRRAGAAGCGRAQHEPPVLVVPPVLAQRLQAHLLRGSRGRGPRVTQANGAWQMALKRFSLRWSSCLNSPKSLKMYQKAPCTLLISNILPSWPPCPAAPPPPAPAPASWRRRAPRPSRQCPGVQRSRG